MNQQEAARDWFSKPGDSIKGALARRKLEPQDLVNRLPGGVDTVRGLFEGTISIDQALAGALAAVVGGSPDFWIRRQANYDSALDEAVSRAFDTEADLWLRNVPAAGPMPSGTLSESKRREQLRRRLAFYDVPTIRSWEARYGRFQSNALFRTSRSFKSKPSSTVLWLRQGELESDLVATRPWSAENLRDRLERIRGLSRISHPARFLPKLRELCAESGVALVVRRTPSGCYASGASALVAPDKAMLLVSFRHRADDQSWFTVFHEFGHLLLHQAQTFVDDQDTPEDRSEQEANDFARSVIIPMSRTEEFDDLATRREAILRFSVSIGVSPGLTVGQMQRLGRVKFRELNSLKRYWTWADIASASS